MLITPEMKKWFKEHNRRRNGIAHTTRVTKVDYIKGQRMEEELKPSAIIKLLEDDIKQLKDIISLT